MCCNRSIDVETETIVSRVKVEQIRAPVKHGLVMLKWTETFRLETYESRPAFHVVPVASGSFKGFAEIVG